MKTLDLANAKLAPDKITIRRWRSRKTYAHCNYVVVLQSGQPHRCNDGTFWDGTEYCGHYVTISEAVLAAKDLAMERNS
jgi:hypothetical protein